MGSFNHLRIGDVSALSNEIVLLIPHPGSRKSSIEDTIKYRRDIIIIYLILLTLNIFTGVFVVWCKYTWPVDLNDSNVGYLRR